MAPKKNAEELRALVREVMLDSLGCTPEEFRAERERKNAGLAESDRIYTGGLNSKYERAAARVIAHDEHGGKGLTFARFARCLAAAKVRGVPPQMIAKAWGDDWLADKIDQSIERALNEGSLAAGGALVPEEFVNEVVEVLRSKSVMRSMGSEVMVMNSGTLTIPRQTAAASAAYVGEGSNVTKTEQEFDQIVLVAKRLAALVPISDDLMADASPQADRLVRDDLAAAMALREDLAFIRDDGTSNKPKGLLFRTSAANKFDITQAGGASTTDEIIGDLYKLIEKVEGSDVPLNRGGWIMTSREKNRIARLRDSVGGFIFREEVLAGSLLGFPIGISNQIPKNLTGGGGTDESEVYFLDFSQAIIGESSALELAVFEGGAYDDGGTIRSGISRIETTIRAVARHDFALRHEEACAIAEQVDWGADS